MKRILTLLLTLSILLSLAACGAPAGDGADTAAACGAPAGDGADTAADSATASTAPEGPIEASNVDDFLAAIGPDREIILEEGTYYLNSAADYGNSKSPYYTWEPVGLNDFALTLNASNLTIRGAGQGKTNLLTEPRTADVLSLTGCRNVTLESMSLGHTVEPQVCDGVVLALRNTAEVTLQDLDLYGCGTVGVMTYDSRDLNIQNCVIHDCSYQGVSLSRCQNVTVQNCAFRSLGKAEPLDTVFMLLDCENATICNNTVTENYTGTVLTVNPAWWSEALNGNDVSFRSNIVSGNRISGSLFSVSRSEFILDNNLFDENESRNWYETGSTHAVDLEGNEVVFEEVPQETVPVTPGVAQPVTTGPQTTVHVSTADEFLKALGNDTCIVLDADLIDLSAASDYPAAEKATAGPAYPANTYDGVTESYYWENNYDGPSLVIDGLHNLTIKAEGNDRAAHVISATPRYAQVLTFDNCSAITLDCFTAGHTKEPGQCMGGVILFQNCEDMLVENCGLFGCGIIGVQARSSRNLQVVNSEIYECSQSGISLTDTDTVAISGTLIRDIGDQWDPNAPFYSFSSAANVTLDGAPLDSNYVGR